MHATRRLMNGERAREAGPLRSVLWVEATASAIASSSGSSRSSITTSGSRGASRSDLRFDSPLFEVETEHLQAAPEAHLDRRLSRAHHTGDLLEGAAFDQPHAHHDPLLGRK